jgi:hypothetical protein
MALCAPWELGHKCRDQGAPLPSLITDAARDLSPLDLGKGSPCNHTKVTRGAGVDEGSNLGSC